MRQHLVITLALLAAVPASADPIFQIKAGEWVSTPCRWDLGRQGGK